MRRSRTLRTVLQFWRSSLEAESEYQLNLVLECLAVSGNLAGSLFVLSLLFSGQSSLITRRFSTRWHGRNSSGKQAYLLSLAQ